jgi:tRNA (mo5U34)-methyltransferase
MSDRGLRDKLKSAAAAHRAVLEATGWWHSIDLGDGLITPGAHSLEELQDNYRRFKLPADLTGRRVLDLGCWDGFYTFEAERHGAEVVAVDVRPSEKFPLAHRALGSRAAFHELSAYEVTRARLDSFDFVLFLGVLYHLRHPLLALERVCEVTSEAAVIETHAIDQILSSDHPVMEFYETDELGGQYDNWWGPNLACLVAMARASGFARVEVLRREPARVTIKAFRRWEQLGDQISPSLRIRDVTSAVNFDHRLRLIPVSGRHAFLAIWVEGLPADVTRERVRVEVNGYGIHPIFAGQVREPRVKGCAQINAPVPPGLDPGVARLRLSCDRQISDEFEVELSLGSEW